MKKVMIGRRVAETIKALMNEIALSLKYASVTRKFVESYSDVWKSNYNMGGKSKVKNKNSTIR